METGITSSPYLDLVLLHTVGSKSTLSVYQCYGGLLNLRFSLCLFPIWVVGQFISGLTTNYSSPD
ncbi:hypothetical protein BDV37DRAFT_42827 [Aspergillus pseudonomiae]|uniref:Uncharacterized protein n=1 Tax=Aspergillus pseudonomiae TaxID=1506151 RepID=A0A5N7CUW8_9EURO|nr:uncharacterized protein BDV37DRAFT_42827 [Aspergillus pseudonomiae]KAE8397934.1 hypothetical protein BDV37DRAFT_42827 [Aspergillus pseudonomiae]